MSRALGQIITLAGAIAVNVIPGLGQLASAAILLGTAAVGSLVSSLGNAGAGKPQTTETPIRAPRPPRVRAFGISRLYGASICFETVNGTTVDVWAFHDGRAAAILRVYLNDEQVTVTNGVVQTLPDKSYQGGHVKAGYNLGLPRETAFGAVQAVLPQWTAQHRGDGVVTGYLLKTPEKEKYFLETYPQGDQVAMSLVGQWTPVFDPRDPTQNAYDPTTWKHSENAVLAFIWYLMVERGKDWNAVFVPQLPRIIAAINDAGSAQPLAAGGSEIRYRTCLSYKATEAPASVIGSLLACFDGWYIFNEEGHLILYSGRVYTPTVFIGPNEITAFSHQSGVADEDFVNEIGVTYVSSLHDYNSVEAEAWRDEEDIAKRGAIRSADLGAVTPSHTQNRRLAKRKMARNNAPDRGRVTTNYSGRTVLGERYINLDLTEGGATFYKGWAEIISLERDEMSGGFTFDWVAVDPNIDAWNPFTEEGEGAPVGNRYAPEPLARPLITSAAVSYATATGDGSVEGTGARIQISVGSDGTSGLTWYARWRVGTGVWNEQAYPDQDPGPSVSLLTSFVPINADVQVQVEYRSAGGQLSGWSDTVTVETVGSPADPAPIASAIIATSKPSEALTITAQSDTGGSSITIGSHDRIYSDRTVAVSGGGVDGLTAETYYSIFYDDAARAGGSVGYQATTSTDEAALSAAHPYRHYVGYVTTPAIGSPPSNGGGASGPGGVGGGGGGEVNPDV